jgi:hypothetical protein
LAFFNLFSEVTGGTSIGIMLLIFYIVVFIGTAFYLVNKYKTVVSSSKLSIGLFMYLVISALISNISLSLLLFPHGEYINYGIGGGLLRLLFSIIIGLLIGFSVIRLVYFKLVK